MSDRGPFRIFLYVLTGLGVLLVLTCGTVAFLAWRNPALREGMAAAMEARTAPGAQELRDAGCREAAVMNVGAMLDAFQEMTDDDVALEETPATFLLCQRTRDVGPGCDEAAEIYLTAVPHPPGRFLVHVVVQDDDRESCQIAYAADGTRLGTLDELERQEQEAREAEAD